jgi:hypothetical protein
MTSEALLETAEDVCAGLASQIVCFAPLRGAETP